MKNETVKEENVVDTKPTEETVNTNQANEVADPLEDIAYFVIFPEKLDIINQAIELIPEKMVVLKDTLVKAINSVLIPVTKEDLDKRENK